MHHKGYIQICEGKESKVHVTRKKGLCLLVGLLMSCTEHNHPPDQAFNMAENQAEVLHCSSFYFTHSHEALALNDPYL